MCWGDWSKRALSGECDICRLFLEIAKIDGGFDDRIVLLEEKGKMCVKL